MGDSSVTAGKLPSDSLPWRPVFKADCGGWGAFTEDGVGYCLHYESEELVQAWLDGFAIARLTAAPETSSDSEIGMSGGDISAHQERTS